MALPLLQQQVLTLYGNFYLVHFHLLTLGTETGFVVIAFIELVLLL